MKCDACQASARLSLRPEPGAVLQMDDSCWKHHTLDIHTKSRTHSHRGANESRQFKASCLGPARVLLQEREGTREGRQHKAIARIVDGYGAPHETIDERGANNGGDTTLFQAIVRNLPRRNNMDQSAQSAPQPEDIEEQVETDQRSHEDEISEQDQGKTKRAHDDSAK